MDRCEDFALFLTQFQDAANELVRKRHLVINKSGDVNISVLDEMLAALGTELSHIGPILNSIDQR